MSAARVAFVVEGAGCASCAERVRDALGPLGAVERVGVDHDSDAAFVTLRSHEPLDAAAVDEALARASEDAVHEYRVRPGSWSAAD